MTWFDRGKSSAVKKAVFAERVPSKRLPPAWLGGPKPATPLKKWLSSFPAPGPRPESSAMSAGDTSTSRVGAPAPVPRFSIPVSMETRIAPTESMRPARTVAPMESMRPARTMPGLEGELLGRPAVAAAVAAAAAATATATPTPNFVPVVSDAAIRERETRLSAAIESLEQSIIEVANLRSRLEPELERQLVALAGLVARRVIGRELSTDPTVMANLALEGMDALGERDKVVARIGPLPDGWAEPMAERLRQHAPRCEVIIDPALEPGQCMVRSEFGQVDESIDTRLGIVLRALLGDPEALPEGVQETEPT